MGTAHNEANCVFWFAWEITSVGIIKNDASRETTEKSAPRTAVEVAVGKKKKNADSFGLVILNRKPTGTKREGRS